MKHVVVSRFRDIEDELRTYEIGEEYPRKGIQVSAARITGLLKGKFIKKIEEKKETMSNE